MHCPLDGTTLHMTERHGVEVDYCPQCRGVWLDRGELEKMLAQAQSGGSAAWRADDDDDDDPSRRTDQMPHSRRRDSWLSDLFDF